MGTVLGRIGVETPKYQVLAKGNDYEIREYEASVVAEVTYDPAQMNRGRDGGFMILANYIGAVGKPHNIKPQHTDMPPQEEEGEKIAMTAPVITQESAAQSESIAMTSPVLTEEHTTTPTESGEGKKLVSMQFILPSNYTLENVPRPSDPKVSVKEVPKRKYGVVTFSGVADDALVQKMLQKLRKSLDDGGYHVIGDYVLARYNPPWTLSFLRTNEVMLPVE
eukprot:Gb_33188 [translate_table: standard]